MEKEKKLPHFELTGAIMQCCFEVMKELGPGFLERIYKNALADCDETIRCWKLEWKRLQLQDAVAEETVEKSVPF